MNCSQAHTIPLSTVLASFGQEVVRHDSHGAFYRSPASGSGDRHPSLQVWPGDRRYTDWCTGEIGGDVIDLTRLFLGGTVSDALRYLEGLGPTGSSRSIICGTTSPHRNPAIIIDDVTPIRSRLLMGYAWGRGIHRGVLTAYCREVHYHLDGHPDRPYYAIGFKNDSGGYELRNKVVKQSSAPKDITTVGDHTGCAYYVFEGFFDCLTAVQLGFFDSNIANALILNSTALVDRAIKALENSGATRVLCLLDHDEAGRHATTKIMAAIPQAVDASEFYLPHKDLNDYYVYNKSARVKCLFTMI